MLVYVHTCTNVYSNTSSLLCHVSQELRHQMDTILKQKIANPKLELYCPHGRTLSPTSKLIEAIIDLITTEDYSKQVHVHVHV